MDCHGMTTHGLLFPGCMRAFDFEIKIVEREDMETPLF
jgi:hypothetical protein